MVIPLTASQKRSILLAVGIVVGLCFLLGSGPDRGSLNRLSTQWTFSHNSTVYTPSEYALPNTHSSSSAIASSHPLDPKIAEITSQPRRANATLMILARNNDLDGVIKSMEQMEVQFNRKFKYPWVLLNEVEFTADFKRQANITVLTDVPVSFGLIPHDHWFQPEWIDEDLAREGRDRLVRQNIIYGGSVSYRNMCRFNSGFFFRHELLQPYKWYWRVEPDVRYFCELDYDPFLFMEEKNKLYGFTISMPEWEPTIPTLWSSIKEFIAENPQYLHPDNSMDFISDNAGDTFNLCHFWSNFEIADMDFWRSEAYMKYFEFLESKGGFYYEVRPWSMSAALTKLTLFVTIKRWGDAPIHILSNTVRKARIGERDIVSCDPNDNFDFAENSCLRHFMRLN
ncbi:glycosyltransferase family 15 protein [Melanogaster broomeanus]|nr:glycosyltransferase family 15 protein [Melanogaster broomeanus]